jgi:hypothetical protein
MIIPPVRSNITAFISENLLEEVVVVTNDTPREKSSTYQFDKDGHNERPICLSKYKWFSLR